MKQAAASERARVEKRDGERERELSFPQASTCAVFEDVGGSAVFESVWGIDGWMDVTTKVYVRTCWQGVPRGLNSYTTLGTI